MKLTPSSTARFRTRFASSRFLGGPQMPWPVIRIAPNPRRLHFHVAADLECFCCHFLLRGFTCVLRWMSAAALWIRAGMFNICEFARVTDMCDVSR